MRFRKSFDFSLLEEKKNECAISELKRDFFFVVSFSDISLFHLMD